MFYNAHKFLTEEYPLLDGHPILLVLQMFLLFWQISNLQQQYIKPDFLVASDCQYVDLQEIVTAISNRRNIVPVTTEAFQWPLPEDLPEDISPICYYNGVKYVILSLEFDCIQHNMKLTQQMGS